MFYYDNNYLILFVLGFSTLTSYGEQGVIIEKNNSKTDDSMKDKKEASFKNVSTRDLSSDFYNLIDDITKIRKSFPLENSIYSPYEEILSNRNKIIITEIKGDNIFQEKVYTDHKEKFKDPQATFDNENSLAMYKKSLEILQNNKREAFALLLNASRLGNNPAKAEIAWSLMYGTYIRQNITMAHELFQQLANEGFPEGHTGLGFLHSLGLYVNASQARAVLHYTIGSLGGCQKSRMMLGSRYWFGMSVSANCEKSLELYRPVASHVASLIGGNGGTVVNRIRLLDEVEDPGHQTGLIDNDLREYYEMVADKGDVTAQIGLGHLYFRGARGLPKDYEKALIYFQKAADTGNSIAMAFVGKIYLEGDEKVKKDLLTAYLSFKKSSDLGNAIGQYGLGFMHLTGMYVEKNEKKAISYLSRSADQGWVESLLVLGTMYLEGRSEIKPDYKMAKKYFIVASQAGHVLGYFNLGRMYSAGIGTIRSCSTAVDLFKSVAERGDWGILLMEAYNHYKNKRFNEAFVIYSVLAEMGYEVAQSNAAFLLDNDLFGFPKEELEEKYRRARMYWSRSAVLGNPLSLVKLGDYHYYGLGTHVDYNTAATFYRVASEHYSHPQAMFNLGYMHENGLGLKRDLHLAKRFYDMAAHSGPDVEFPAYLALIKLYLVMIFDKFGEADWLQLLTLHWVNAYLGRHWDLYFTGLLLICTAYLLHYRINRRDLFRDLLNFL